MDAKQMQAVLDAKKKIAEAGLTLWNTRLEALVAAGDARGILDHLSSPVEDKIDNCGCNVQCGAARDGLQGVLSNPAVRG